MRHGDFPVKSGGHARGGDAEPSGPPAVAQLIAELVLSDAALRESVVGDLAEEHHAIARRSSKRAADAWYRWQVIRSIAPLAAMGALRRGAGGWLRTGLAAVIGYAVLAFLVILTNQWLGAFLVARSADSWIMPAASLAAGALCAVIAGYVAAVAGGAARMAAAFALGVACVTLSVLMLQGAADGTPLWYRVGLAAVVLPAVCSGGVIRARSALVRSKRNLPGQGVPPT
jgi:hypothetical protein